MNDNPLSKIPGDILGRVGASLPSAEVSQEKKQTIIVRLPDGARAEVTFVKLKSIKGKTTRWFWTPSDAVILEDFERDKLDSQ